MTKEQAFKEINETQDYYVDELKEKIVKGGELKEINFSSDTGTGKTKMMSKLINKMPDYFFIITTLSKGQLNKQVEKNLKQDCLYDNFKVHGVCDYTANTKLTYKDILDELPDNKNIVWLRDEGHIHTNKWQPLLENRCYRIVNISATNNDLGGIECNFKHTMMLRTVIQKCGEISDALDKLIEVKKQHSKVSDYNPCAILRCLSSDIVNIAIDECTKRNLKYINITTDDYDMSDICEDNNEYDVIINKFKIVEGIDIRRAHVIWLENEPGNPKTTIQLIGRCRRNALLYRDDIDIFKLDNQKLLENTRQCYAFYNVQDMKIDSDECGNLINAFCDIISCQKLKVGSIIKVKSGKMLNGLTISELQGEDGEFEIKQDEKTGFNIVYPTGKYYKKITNRSKNTIYLGEKGIYMQKDIENYKIDLEKAPKRAYGLSRMLHIIRNGPSNVKEVDLSKFLGVVEKKTAIGWSVQESALKYTLFGQLVTEQCRNKIYERISSFSESEVNDKYFDFSIRKVSKQDKFKVAYKEFLPIQYINYNKEDRHTSLDELVEWLDNKRSYYKCVDNYEEFNTKQEASAFISEMKKKKINLMFSYCWGSSIIEVADFKNNLIKILQQIKYKNCTAVRLDDFKTTLDKLYDNYIITLNDTELATLAGENYQYNKGAEEWLESRSITSLVNKHCKFNTFIENKYKQELDYAKKFTYNGKNNFNLDTRCNACLGYCVEYYSKYLVYGEKYLEEYIEKAKKESKVDKVDIGIIVRACMLKYKENMVRCYGAGMEKLIRTISIEQLIQEKYREFLSIVVELGTKTAEFVKQNLKIEENKIDIENKKIYINQKDPCLITTHFVGLCDYIDENTIIDIKTTSNITTSYIKQVLAYHYLSTKRSDLNIKKVIIYDAVKNKCIKIPITAKNLKG